VAHRSSEVGSLRILFCPTHYLYDDAREGSELAWAYNIADRIGRECPGSVVITGKSSVRARPYRIIELTPWETRLNFGLLSAFAFNARYTLAALRALQLERFDLVHHVLPFAIGKTHNVAALRHRGTTPYVIGPVQPPLKVPDSDVDPNDLRIFTLRDPAGVPSLRKAIGSPIRSLASDVIAPVLFSGLSRRTIARASAVITVNEEAAEFVVRNGASPERVVVIPPGVDTRRFRSASARKTQSTNVNLLCVSRLLRRKNIDVVIEALANVVENEPQVRLRIVGDGPERKTLKSLTKRLGLEGKVTFAGFVPNAAVHEEYSQADVFVNASAAEGFATTCLEALASGLPVVSTRVGGFANAIKDGENGYLITDADPSDLAARLRRLVADPTLVAVLSARARDLAERTFDWDKAVIPQYLELYSRVIRERTARDFPGTAA
jgi:glycosyltransferase involved in cell wall biosynthesis